jgi:hypothetical protein
MYDISISNTKIKGRPKGRPQPFCKKYVKDFPEPLPYRRNPYYLYKVQLWMANIEYRKAEGQFLKTRLPYTLT